MNEYEYFNSFSGERSFDNRSHYFMAGDMIRSHWGLGDLGNPDELGIIHESSHKYEHFMLIEVEYDFVVESVEDLYLVNRIDD